MSAGLGLAVATLRTKPKRPQPSRDDEWVDVPEEGAQVGAETPAGTLPPPDIRTGITMGDWADVPVDEPPIKRGPLEHVSRAYGEATIGAPTLGKAISQFAEGAPYMARHPVESAKMLGRGMLESHAQAAEAAKRQMARPGLAHKMVGALRYGVSGIPIIGPSLVQAGEQTAEKEGGYWKALGTTLGAATWLTTVMGGKPIVRGYEKLAARMEKAPVEISMPKPGMAKQPVTPHEAARLTRQEVMEAAEARGIKLTAAQATKDPLLETVEWVGGKALGGADKLLKQTERSRAGVLEWAEDIRSKADPYRRGATEEAAGTDLKQSVSIAEEIARENVRKSFDQPWMKETEGPGTVDLEPVRGKFADELGIIADALKREPGKYGSRVADMLAEGAEVGAPAIETVVLGAKVGRGGIKPSELPPRMAAQLGMAAPKRLSFAEAHRLRADFYEMGYKGKQLGIPDRVQSAARRIGHEMTLEMENSAKARGTLEQWKAADAEWGRLKDTYDNPRSTVRRVQAEPDPTKALSVVFRNPTPRSLRLLAQEGYDLAAIKSEAIRRIKTKGYKLDEQGRLVGLPHEFLRELFGDEQLHQIYIMADVGRTVAPKPAGLPEKLSRYAQATSAAAIPAAVVGGGPALQMLAAGPIAAHTVAARIAASTALKRAVTKPTQIRAGVGLAERMKAMRAHERVWPPRPKRPPEEGAIKWKGKQKPVNMSEAGGLWDGFINADGKFSRLGVLDTHIEALARTGRDIDKLVAEENFISARGTTLGEVDFNIGKRPTRAQISSMAKYVRLNDANVIMYDFGYGSERPVSGLARNIGEFMGAIEKYFGKSEEPIIQRINPREAADLGVSAKRVPEVLRRRMETGSAKQAAAKRVPAKPSLVEKVGEGRAAPLVKISAATRAKVIEAAKKEGYGADFIEQVEKTQSEYLPYWNKPLPARLRADFDPGEVLYHGVADPELVLRRGIDARKPGITSGSTGEGKGWAEEFIDSGHVRDHPPGTIYLTPDIGEARLYGGHVVGVRIPPKMRSMVGVGDEMAEAAGSREVTVYGIIPPEAVVKVRGKTTGKSLVEKIGKGRKRP